MVFHKERMRNTVVLIYICIFKRYKKWQINVFKSGNYLKKKHWKIKKKSHCKCLNYLVNSTTFHKETQNSNLKRELCMCQYTQYWQHRKEYYMPLFGNISTLHEEIPVIE